MTQTPPGDSRTPDSGADRSDQPRRSLFDRARSALRPNNRRLLAEMIRYGLVSVIALVVDYATLFICYELLGWHYLTAATLAFSFGIVANFICSRVWVFDKSKHHTWVEVAIFLAVGVTGLGLNNLIMYVAHDKFAVAVMVAKIISTAIVFFWNFLLRRFLIYTGADGDQGKGGVEADSAGPHPSVDAAPTAGPESPEGPGTDYGSSSAPAPVTDPSATNWPATNPPATNSDQQD